MALLLVTKVFRSVDIVLYAFFNVSLSMKFYIIRRVFVMNDRAPWNIC
jgi:hypothetical protein